MTAGRQPSLQAPRPRPITTWISAFFTLAIIMPIAIRFLEIDYRPLAIAMLLGPLVLLAKAVWNAALNARQRESAAAPTARYAKRMLAITLIYVASLFAALSLVEPDVPVGPAAILLALAQGLAVASYFWAIGRLLVEMEDEFLKMLFVRQSLIATGFTMAAASVWGFLENFGITSHVDAFWWPIAWFAGLGLGAIVNRVQYGSAGEAM
ncbi:MAG: hypothetical protein ACX930_13985 [Erythrobacter sp.]